MRNYWIRIALGAFAVFAVGMVIHNVGSRAKDSIENTLNSTDPISLPIAFVPFRLDGQKVGTIKKVVLLRNDPKHISSVRVVVEMADSQGVNLLQDCLIAVDDLERLNDRSTFRCQQADTAGSGLEHFGVVSISGTTDSFPLLLPASAVQDIKTTALEIHIGHQQAMTDSVNEAVEAQTDSISAVAEARADSISAAAERMGDSISRAATRMADSIRVAAQKKARSPQ
jgi:hypothetical protein